MFVRDIMTTNVVTIPSNTLMVEARKTMAFHRIGRLPVVDKGKLVGIVAKDLLERSGPSQATSLARYELDYILAKLTVKEIMRTKVVTITPDATVEQAVAIAQSNQVGCLPVEENGRVVGIVTTNDFFYKVLNPLLGIGEKGTRIIVYGASDTEQMQKVLGCISKHKVGIKAIMTMVPLEAKKNDLILHLDIEDASPIVRELKNLGFSADTREFKPC